MFNPTIFADEADDNVDGTLVLLETTISGNTTQREGGGIARRSIYTYEPGSVRAPGNVEMINSTISENHISGEFGYPRSARLFKGEFSELVLIHSTISGNSLEFNVSETPYEIAGSGAVLYGDESRETKLIHATIANNTSSIGGGVSIHR
jgi:hypothetical protein